MDTGISASFAFTEWEACIAAGLSIWEWERGVYPNRFKARVMAWHHIHNLVEQHSNAAQADAMEKKAKAKNKK